jgi:hypothetical protein
MPELRYPIGRFAHPSEVSDDDLALWSGQIEALPAELRRAVDGLGDEQLDTPYRPGGWTLRQVVHHLPDSHLHAYVRFKWALTEDEPAIKTYEEARWAELADSLAPVAVSLDLLAALHERWVTLIRALDRGQLARHFVHPEWGTVDLAHTVGSYAWHGRHHLAHVTTTREREGW